jgi:eukaryotic-like serine/threonine-protein kinase
MMQRYRIAGGDERFVYDGGSVDGRLVIAERFEIEHLVGTGGMGEVFRAKDRLTGGPVAIKLLHPGMTRDQERFKREAQLLAELSHPRVVRYVAHGVATSGRPYIAMEWLEGLDLSDRLSHEGFTLDEAVTLARRASEALGALHERGIVHRDVKPSNLFLVGADLHSLKLLDLGIARLSTPTRPATRSGIMVGTPGYMAPEQARGAKEIDARADVFSLGCVLFECIAGRPAFVGDNAAALLAKILLDESPRILDYRPDAPPELDDLVSRMLAKHPAARPNDGHAVARELAQLSRSGLDSQRRSSIRALRAITGGERRLVSVVMASSILMPVEGGAETLTGDTSVASLDMRSVVSPFGAKFESLADGSVVVAVTGKGSATDQAAHAARCALAIRSHMPEAHMVLATGLATVTDRAMFGDVLDRAAAMLVEARRAFAEIGPDGTVKSLPLPLPVRLDETTAGLLDLRFDVEGDDLGLTLRGPRAEEGSKRTLLGKATPFVGRDRELATLHALVEECISEPVARVVLVTAPPGGGKPRLVHELLVQARGLHTNVEVWLARGDPMSEGSPFHMLAQGIRRACGSVEGEPLAVRRQKLRARLARHLEGDDLTRVTEFIGELVGTPFQGDTSVQLRAARQDAMLMGDQMRRAWEDWIAAECLAQPVVIVLEDLQWGDLPSVKLIDAALRNLPELPLLVVAVARPEVHEVFPGLWSERGLQEVRLGPLVKSASDRLVRQVLPDANHADVARLVERSAGNAFYLEELIRAVAEGRGAELPETVLAMVEARLERLEPEGRRLLRAASVFGQVFWRGGVAALLGQALRASEVDEWLAELVGREILLQRRRSKFPTEPEYAFRHALVREAAYAMLTSEDRSLGHKLAGEWLEEAGETDAVVLAEHFDRGSVLAHAVQWYRRAAEQALEGNDFDSATGRAEAAIAAGAQDLERGSLRLLQASAADWNGDTIGAMRFADEALRELQPGSDDWYLAAGELALASRKLGEFERVHAVGRAVHAFDAQPGSSPARLTGTARVTGALYLAGGFAEGDRLLGVLERAGAAVAPHEPAVAAWIHFARGARALWSAEVEEDLVSTLSAIAEFARAGDLRNVCMNQVTAGFILSSIGQFEEAERVLREALDASDRMGLRATSLLGRQNLGATLARLGRLDEALRVEREALEGYRTTGDQVWEAISRVYLGLLLRLSGDLAAADREIRTAIESVRFAPPVHAAALGSHALVLLDLPDPVGARVAAEEAMRIFREVGGVLEGESLIRLVYSESLWATGDKDAARKAIAGARDRLIARADAIKNPVWRKSFLERVRENIRTLARAGEWLR